MKNDHVGIISDDMNWCLTADISWKIRRPIDTCKACLGTGHIWENHRVQQCADCSGNGVIFLSGTLTPPEVPKELTDKIDEALNWYAAKTRMDRLARSMGLKDATELGLCKE